MPETISPARLLPPADDSRPSRDPDYIAQLATDLEARGMIYPIFARRQDADLEVLAGEARRLAALRAGLTEVPFVVLDRPLTETESLLERLREDEFRSNLPTPERARIYADLMHLNGWTQSQLAHAVGVSGGEVSRTLSVSNRLPADLLERLARGELRPAVAYQLSRIAGHEAMRPLAEKALRGLLTRDAAAAHVRRLLDRRPKPDKPIKARTQGGLLLVIPSRDPRLVLAELTLVTETIRRAAEDGLTLDRLPSLLDIA